MKVEDVPQDLKFTKGTPGILYTLLTVKGNTRW